MPQWPTPDIWCASVKESHDSEYLSAFLNSAYAKRVLRNMCKSIVGMANINATEIQAMPIALPPCELQRKFAVNVAKVESLRSIQLAASTHLNTLFTSLQHRAFRGEL